MLRIVSFNIFKDWFWNPFMKLVIWVYFLIIKCIAWVLDMLTQLFFIFAGMTPINSPSLNTDDGIDTGVDIVNFFLTQEKFQKVYLYLCGIALVLIVVFTIAKIIKQDYFDRSGPRSKGPIFRNVALSFIAFICIIPIFYFLVQAAGALALLVMKAMGYTGGGIGTLVFNLSWTDNGRSFRELASVVPDSDSYDKNMFWWPGGDSFYYYFWNEGTGVIRDTTSSIHYSSSRGSVVVDRAQFHWWLYFFVSGALIGSLGKMLLAMISRLYKLIALFIVAPAPISQIVLDDGAKFKGWKDQVIQEALKVVGCVMSFMLFILIASAVPSMDFMMFAFTEDAASAKNIVDSNSLISELSNDIDLLYYHSQDHIIDQTMNSLAKCLVLMAGAGAVQDIDSVVTKHISGGSSSMDIGASGKAITASAGAAAKGALAIGKKAITGTVALAGGLVKAGHSIGASLKDAPSVVKNNKIEGAQNLLAQEKKAKEDAAKANTVKGSSGTANAPTSGNGGGNAEEVKTPQVNAPTSGEEEGKANAPTSSQNGNPSTGESESSDNGNEEKITATESAETPAVTEKIAKAQAKAEKAQAKANETGEAKDRKKAQKAQKKVENIAKRQSKTRSEALNKAQNYVDNKKAKDAKKETKALRKNTNKFARTMKGIGAWAVSPILSATGDTLSLAGTAVKTGASIGGIALKTAAQVFGFGTVANAMEDVGKTTVDAVKSTEKKTVGKIAARHKKSVDLKNDLLKNAQDYVGTNESKTKPSATSSKPQTQSSTSSPGTSPAPAVSVNQTSNPSKIVVEHGQRRLPLGEALSRMVDRRDIGRSQNKVASAVKNGNLSEEVGEAFMLMNTYKGVDFESNGAIQNAADRVPDKLSGVMDDEELANVVNNMSVMKARPGSEIDTMDKYRSSVQDRYKRASASYQSAVAEFKAQMNAYNTTHDQKALENARKIMKDVVTWSDEFNRARKDIEEGNKK